MADTLKALPAMAESEGGALPDMLVRASEKALRKFDEILDWPVKRDDEGNMRILLAAGDSVTKLLARVSEANMRHSARNDLIEQMAQRIAELEAKK